MSKHKPPEEFLHESLEDSGSIAKYLEALAQGLKSGRLLFCSGETETLLKPNGLLRLSLRTKRKDGQVKVTVKFGWKDRHRDGEPDEPLVIRAARDE